MIKRAPNALQIALMAAFIVSCFGLLLGLWISFGGPAPLKPRGYRIHVSFSDAAQLEPQADVRISGVSVGTVVSLKLQPRAGVTDAVLQIDPEFAPRPSDTRAILRQKSFLGETFIALSPGSPRAPKLPEEGTLGPSHVEHAVSVGELLRTFDPSTRHSFAIWMEQQGGALASTGEALNSAIGVLGPFAARTDDLVALVDQEGAATRRLISAGGLTLDAITAQPGRLRALVRSTDLAFSATSRQDRALAATVSALGPFLSESRLTLDRLARFSHDTRPLTDRLVPVAHALTRVLHDAPGAAAPLRRLFAAAPALERAAARGVPATVRVLRRSRPLLKSLRPYLGQIIPVLDYAAKYRGELAATLGNVGAATQSTLPGARTGTPLHLLRAVGALSPESLAAYHERLRTDRTDPYLAPGGYRQLPRGLEAWATGCGHAVLPTLAATIPPELQRLIRRFYFTERPANVACRSQRPLGPQVGHGSGDFPRVTALP